MAVWLTLPKPEDSNWKAKLSRIDFAGALTLLCAVFALLIAMDRGSNVSWTDRFTLAALGSSIPLIAIFLFVETRFAKEPFAPGRIVFGDGLVACYLCYFFTMCGFMAATFYVPL